MPSDLPSDLISASAIADERLTRYVCAGRGDPVLLLIEDASLLAALLRRFPRWLRAVVPERPPAATQGEFDDWLRDFLEAIGLGHAALVADQPMAPAAIAFARASPTQVSRVVLVPDASGAEAAAREVMSLLTEGASAPIDFAGASSILR